MSMSAAAGKAGWLANPSTRVPSSPQFDALQLRPGPPRLHNWSSDIRCPRAPSSATTPLARPHSTRTHASPATHLPTCSSSHVLAPRARQCASTRTSAAGSARLHLPNRPPAPTRLSPRLVTPNPPTRSITHASVTGSAECQHARFTAQLPASAHPPPSSGFVGTVLPHLYHIAAPFHLAIILWQDAYE
ncbi:hypothetical protein FIBSPDRAFT_944415 [Athelia psychrophila]|nr:hypothetical protein FIBSPDRAFT_944415 [Fibularhizoctonia sp. CBS 109695]